MHKQSNTMKKYSLVSDQNYGKSGWSNSLTLRVVICRVRAMGSFIRMDASAATSIRVVFF